MSIPALKKATIAGAFVLGLAYLFLRDNGPMRKVDPSWGNTGRAERISLGTSETELIQQLGKPLDETKSIVPTIYTPKGFRRLRFLPPPGADYDIYAWIEENSSQTVAISWWAGKGGIKVLPSYDAQLSKDPIFQERR